MVFWSSFAKKVKQAVSQAAFDLLKNRVNNVETENQNQDTKINANQQNITQLTNTTNQHTQLINTNKTNISNNYNSITTLDNKVNSVITGLQNGNIVNYAGNYSASTTYHLAQAITYNGDWFVSNQDNNVGHTPSKTSSTYWVYISAPTVDLTQYLTISSANATYATQNELNGFESNTTTTLNNLDSRINNLQSAKADLSYLNNNFYNKTYIDSRKVKYRDITITNVIRNRNLISNELWIAQFETNFTPSSYDYLVNNIIFYDILFLGATYTNWKHKITASYTSGSPAKLAIEMLYTEEQTVKIQTGQIVRIWYSEEINR